MCFRGVSKNVFQVAFLLFRTLKKVSETDVFFYIRIWVLLYRFALGIKNRIPSSGLATENFIKFFLALDSREVKICVSEAKEYEKFKMTTTHLF